MKKDVRDRGFTLVELAIVMVVIGLMIGAVLKGQSMIDNAKQRRLMNDLQGISAAYFTYFDKFNAVPGDDAKANSRWTNVANGNANGVISGTPTTPTGESQEAWQALRYAGLLSGDPAATGASSLATHPFGGIFGLSSRSFGSAVASRGYKSLDSLSLGEVQLSVHESPERILAGQRGFRPEFKGKLDHASVIKEMIEGVKLQLLICLALSWQTKQKRRR